MKSDTAAFFFNVGATNRFDLGVAVPLSVWRWI
jgi:hypothetical protein